MQYRIEGMLEAREKKVPARRLNTRSLIQIERFLGRELFGWNQKIFIG
jgi:hypothetical protein